MSYGLNTTLSDVQLAILEFLFRNSSDQFYPMTIPGLCSVIQCHDRALVIDSLKLLAYEDNITIRQYGDTGFENYVPKANLNPFIHSGGNFEFKTTPMGRRTYENLKLKSFRSLGIPAANAAVQETTAQLSNVLSLDRGFAAYCIRILEELVRVGVRNYQDRYYLREPAQRYMKDNASLTRREHEEHFYQPFLRTELQRDEVLAGCIVEGASISGGYTDIMTIFQIPIETKVIYPTDEREESSLMKTGAGQAVQYAALSRIAFLSVLDLRPRPSVFDLSNIQNDVSVITQHQTGGYDVFIVRIQHICGFGRPSAVQR